MITICVPTYNFPNYDLIGQLVGLLKNSTASIELVVIDDASKTSERFEPNKLPSLVKFHQLESNIGRAKIRNKFLEYASQDYLLFIDGDSKLIGVDLLENYLEEIEKSKAEVICGRSVYPDVLPPKLRRLRWKYGKSIESQSVERRKTEPYRSFMTNNFLIKKSVFKQIMFDETLTGYGHEDTLFGFELKRKQIEILHIHNPVLNAETETNEVYLEKTKSAINNLIIIWGQRKDKDSFAAYVKLLTVYSKMKAFRFDLIVKLLFNVFGKTIEKQLKSGNNNNLTLFSFWKLGLLVSKLK